jgi:hypothetical protein
MGTGSSWGVKWAGCGVDTHPHLVPRLKESGVILSLPLWDFVACSRVTFTFTFTLCLKIINNNKKLIKYYISRIGSVPVFRHESNVGSAGKSSKVESNFVYWTHKSRIEPPF